MKAYLTLSLLLLTCWGCIADPEPETPFVEKEEGKSDSSSADSGSSEAPVFQVKFTTSQGDFVVEVHPEWAPNGAEQFRKLVREGFYNDCRFFRVVGGFMAQFGINGDPATHKKFDSNIPPDAVKQSNKRGMVTFAMAGSPDSRSTQLFISYGDNSFLDGQGFAPIGKVVDGMSVVDQLYAVYGDGPPQGAGPDQGQIQEQGNAYLIKEYPELDYIKSAVIVGVVPESESVLGASTSESTPETEPATPEAQPAAPAAGTEAAPSGS